MKADSPKRPRAVGFRSYETSRMGKATETECGLAVARGWGEGVGVTANGYRVFGGGAGVALERDRGGGWVHSPLDVLTAPEALTLKWPISCHPNSASIIYKMAITKGPLHLLGSCPELDRVPGARRRLFTGRGLWPRALG